ncbi:MAG TPA: DUF929 family protein [Jatrophihabitantaceae bacterium]|nr:DUF929 family protein [Jatrophihabitantaceae bacterium]
MNDIEDRLRQLLTQAPPELGAIDPETLLAPRATQRRSARPRLVATAASVAAVAGVAVALATLGHSGPVNRQPGNQAGSEHPPAGTFAHIPESVYDAVGAPAAPGHVAVAVSKLEGPALTADGRPEVLHVGADWAPYDAAERWVLAAALSRFGTLSGLALTASKSDDVDPNTATLSFHGARLASDQVSAVFKDIEGTDMKPLDRLTTAEEQIFAGVARNSFPFIDVAGRYKIGTQFDPAVLKGLDQAQIADALTDPTSPVAKAVLGAANVLTAAICDVTGGQPADVCGSTGVAAAKRLLDTVPGQPANTNATN